MRHMEEGGLSRAILELVGDAGLCRLDRPPERESSQDVAFVDRGVPRPSFRRKDAGLPSELEASSNLRLDSRPAAKPSGQMLDAQETLEHGGSRRCDPHPEIVIEGHSGPADVLCQVESKAEDKVAAVTFYGRFVSSRRRAARRPFRPPWRNRFSLGRSSFGGRSFFFMAGARRGAGRGVREPRWTLGARRLPYQRWRGFCLRCGRGRAGRTPPSRGELA